MTDFDDDRDTDKTCYALAFSSVYASTQEDLERGTLGHYWHAESEMHCYVGNAHDYWADRVVKLRAQST